MDLNPVHGVCLAHLPPLIAEFNLRTDQHTPYSLLAHETHSYIAPTRVAIKRNKGTERPSSIFLTFPGGAQG